MPDGGSPASFFDRAVKAAPEDTDYLFNLGYAYALGHEAPAALFWLREAVRFDATNGDAHLVMSAVLESTGKTVEAQRELELAKLLGTRRDVPIATPRESVPLRLERLRTDLDASISRRFASTVGMSGAPGAAGSRRVPPRRGAPAVRGAEGSRGDQRAAAGRSICRRTRTSRTCCSAGCINAAAGCRKRSTSSRSPSGAGKPQRRAWPSGPRSSSPAIGRPRAAKPSARSCCSRIPRRLERCWRRSIVERVPRFSLPAAAC